MADDPKKLAMQRSWYDKPDNRSRTLKRVRKRKRELAAWVRELKRKQGCDDCGEKDPICLVFHHINGKTVMISKMVNQGYGKTVIWEEMKKCVILCENCHRKEHRRLRNEIKNT